MTNHVESFLSSFSSSEELKALLNNDPALMSRIKEDPIFKENRELILNELKTRLWPLIRDVFEEKRKREHTEQIPEEHRKALFCITMIFTAISDELVNKMRNDQGFAKTLSLVNSAIRSEEELGPLLRAYNENKKDSERLIEGRIKKLEMEFYGDQYGNVQAIKSSNKPNKDEVIDRITNSCLEKNGNAKLQSIKRLRTELNFLLSDTLLDLNCGILKIKSGDPQMKERIALAAYKPHELCTSYYLKDEDLELLPFNGIIKHLSIPIVRDLITWRKEGKEVSSFFAVKYRNGTQQIEDVAKSEYMSPPFSGMVCCRRKALDEIIKSYKKKLYYPATCALLAMIEGLIWSFAEFINQSGNEIFEYGEDKKIKFIIDKASGAKNNNTTVGTLLNISAIGEVLDKDFISYFCGEFYKKRNDLMHGDNWGEADIVKTSEKMAVLEHVLIESQRYIKEYHIRNFKLAITEDLIEKIFKQISKNIATSSKKGKKRK